MPGAAVKDQPAEKTRDPRKLRSLPRKKFSRVVGTPPGAGTGPRCAALDLLDQRRRFDQEAVKAAMVGRPSRASYGR